MNKLAIIFLACVILSGCASAPVFVDRIVEVPTIVYEPRPEVPEVEKLTDLPIYHLTHNSTASEVARAYVQTVEILTNKIKQYEEAMLILDEE